MAKKTIQSDCLKSAKVHVHEAAGTCERIMVNAREAALLFGIGRTTWLSLTSAGKTPEPTRLGGSVKWRLEELKLWAAAGCPSRQRWEGVKGSAC